MSKNNKALITGKSACVDGRIHRWPERNSGKVHTFGAAAVREKDQITVTFYADVYGERTGEIEYSSQEWDHFIQLIIDSKGDIRENYKVLDRMIEAFAHAPLDTMVTIDMDMPPEKQVSVARDGKEGPRVVTDSIKSAEAFIRAAEQGEFFAEQLLEATLFVPIEEYYSPQPV